MLINIFSGSCNRSKRFDVKNIMLYCVRPMYYAEGWWDYANNLTSTQVGLDVNGTLKFGLEEILYDYQVDVAIWAHTHSYDRMWPVYNYTVFNGLTTSKTWTRVTKTSTSKFSPFLICD